MVLANFLLMTSASKKASKVRVLDRVFWICYPVQFRKDKGKDVLALLDSRNKKIDGSSLATYGIIIAAFQVVDKLSQSQFLWETF